MKANIIGAKRAKSKDSNKMFDEKAKPEVICTSIMDGYLKSHTPKEIIDEFIALKNFFL